MMSSQQSEHLLAYLKNMPLLAGYSLSLYRSGQALASDEVGRQLCGAQGIPHLCGDICAPSLSVAIEAALNSRKPVFFRCPLGLLSFAVPFSADSCLVCGGVRENLFDLYFRESEQFDFLKGKKKAHPYEILEQLEKLPVTTEKEARETMLKVERLVASFIAEERMQPSDSTDGLTSVITKIAAAIGKAESFTGATALFGETFGILFDIPAIALALRDEESDCFLMESCWGDYSGPLQLPASALPFHEDKFLPTIVTGEELTALFPHGGMTSALCLPLAEDRSLFGMAVLFNVSLSAHDLSCAELLTGELVKKFKQSTKEREARHSQRDVRLLEMFRILALTESQEELLHLIIEMAAELVGAANGSLMLLDREGKSLRVASALGINPVLAHNLYTRVDEGIAGRVAASGVPLLISDIEQELRPARKNRTRFASKSCISLPLLFKGKTIGVVNLADKKRNVSFTSADQEILTTFLDQATIILERSTILRKAKQSIITDPLTGLYNLHFVKKRLNEELSRSIRYSLPLTLLLASLDNIPAGRDAVSRANTDRLVKEMARILGASLRDIDLIGRIGKNEFCIILPSTPKKEYLPVVERIKHTIEKELTHDGGQNREYMATSIGVASFPENGTTPSEMINAARAALSRAKSEGGSLLPPEHR